MMNDSAAGPPSFRVPTWRDREAVRQRPPGSPVMYQRWEDLLFLHWRWDAAAIQRTLPKGLFVDTFQGSAWLGVVPFAMCGVRPRGLPAVPGISNFLELNLRTYVHAADGTPGVWFYSLDCNRRLAVAVARTLFGLPYVYARMAAQGHLGQQGGVASYTARRPGASITNEFEYDLADRAGEAPNETLEWWLVERYVLFSGGHAGRPLRAGRVWHRPYQVAQARMGPLRTTLFADNGFVDTARPPDHVLAAAGVKVNVYPMHRCAVA